MSLYRKVRPYFIDVINTTDFLLAPDLTGVYLFTENTDLVSMEEKIVKLENLLALDTKQVILCVVDKTIREKGEEIVCLDSTHCVTYLFDVNQLENAIRTITGSRLPVFKRRELNEIIDCYYDVKPVTDSLLDVLETIGVPLSDAKKIRDGIPVYEALDESDYSEDELDAIYEAESLYHSIHRVRESVFSDKSVSVPPSFVFMCYAKSCILSIMAIFLSLYDKRLCWVGIGLVAFALADADSAKHTNRTIVTMACFLLAGIALLLCLQYPVTQLVVLIRELLRSSN